MAITDTTYKSQSATWNSSAFDCPAGFQFRRTVEYLDIMCADRHTPLKALQKVTFEGDVSFNGLATPRSATTRATLSVVALKTGIGGGTVTVALANARGGNVTIDGDSQPHKQTETFVGDPQASEDLAAISVS